MTRTSTFAGGLAALGIALLVAPALFPVQPVLFHDTDPGTTMNGSQLAEQNVTVVAYEDLSDRGKELYLAALRNGGEYTVPQGQGASDFAYPSNAELREVEDYDERRRMMQVVIERPDDGSLPPADEPVDRAEYVAERESEREGGSNRSEAEIRAQIARYDAMTTRTGQPDLMATPSLLRFLSAAGGVLAIGVGGYVRSKP